MGDFKWVRFAQFATMLFRSVLDFLSDLNGGDHEELKRQVAKVIDPDSPVESVSARACPRKESVPLPKDPND